MNDPQKLIWLTYITLLFYFGPGAVVGGILWWRQWQKSRRAVKAPHHLHPLHGQPKKSRLAG